MRSETVSQRSVEECFLMHDEISPNCIVLRMSFTAVQIEQISAMLDTYRKENRPPEQIRPKLDIGWRLDKQTVYLFEIRPRWNDPSVIDHHDFAKATWVDSAKEWRIYWMRASLKWYRYDALPSVGNLQRFLLELSKDPYGCFRG